MPKTDNVHFAQNLKYICSFEKSVAKICRNLNINRSQFGRYLRGETLPSANNLRLLCNYFNVTNEDFFLSSDRFIAVFSEPSDRRNDQTNPKNTRESVADLFQEHASAMKPYLGDYLVHHNTASWPGFATVFFCRIHIHNGHVFTKFIQRGISPEVGTRYVIKQSGQALYREGRIYIVYFNMPYWGPICTEVIDVNRSMSRNILTSNMLTVTKNTNRTITGKHYWKYLGPNNNVKRALKNCGHHELTSTKIDPLIRRLLNEE